MSTSILEDVLGYGMIIVFCGMAVSTQSRERNAYFAGSGNKFWTILKELELTETKLEPAQYKKVKKFGIGLTDLVKTQFGSDKVIKTIGKEVEVLKVKIEKYQPIFFAFNGKTSAKLYFKKRKVEYGEQEGNKIGKTRIFILPSTSGAARGYWDKGQWKKISDLVKEVKK